MLLDLIISATVCRLPLRRYGQTWGHRKSSVFSLLLHVFGASTTGILQEELRSATNVPKSDTGRAGPAVH